MHRLDYLNGLGVTAVWLMPFQTSPGRDDGYDVADCYNVDPRYGTLGDFVEFTHAAHQRGIRLLIDLVVNHTSNEHRGSRTRGTIRGRSIVNGMSGRKRNRPMQTKAWSFQGMQKTTWTYDKEAKAYYFHRFYDFQPVLRIGLAPTARRSFAAWATPRGIKHAWSQALKARLRSSVGVITLDMIAGVTRAFSACRDFYSIPRALPWLRLRLRLRR